jgi:hypothetical protein
MLIFKFVQKYENKLFILLKLSIVRKKSQAPNFKSQAPREYEGLYFLKLILLLILLI